MRRTHDAPISHVRSLLIPIVAVAIGCGSSPGVRSPQTPATSAAPTTVAAPRAAPVTPQPPSPFAGIPPEVVSKLNIALAKAYAATAEAFELLGGAGAGANPRRENAPAARAKLIEAQALLDAAAPGSAYPRDRFAVLYAHSDYLRAMNLYLLGSLETDWQQTDRFWAPSVEHAESGYEISLRYISDPAFLQNARNCATLAIQLHHVLIVSAALNSDDEGMAYHKVRESELKAWLEKSLSNQ